MIGRPWHLSNTTDYGAMVFTPRKRHKYDNLPSIDADRWPSANSLARRTRHNNWSVVSRYSAIEVARVFGRANHNNKSWLSSGRWLYRFNGPLLRLGSRERI